MGEDSGRKRVVSLSGYVTFHDRWEATLSHVFATLDASGREALFFRTGVNPPPKPSRAQYAVTIMPKTGLAWGEVEDVGDLDLVPGTSAYD